MIVNHHHTLLRPIIRSSTSVQAFVRSTVARKAPARAMTILSKESKEDFKKQNYSERMSRSGRPVSPHVTIYSFPIGALTSITNRVTGVALSLGAFGLASTELLAGPGAALAVCQSIANADSVLVPAAAKICVAFPFVYHFLGGVRHVTWDHRPETLTNAGVDRASKILVASSLLLTGAALVV